jgi:hypothetical protein
VTTQSISTLKVNEETTGFVYPESNLRLMHKKVPITGTFFYSHQPQLFSPTADFSNDKNDQRNKANYNQNAPYHASLKNTFNHRTTD